MSRSICLQRPFPLTGMTELTITPSVREGAHVLILEGELDTSNADSLEAVLGERRDAPLIVDVSVLRFIDSSGLHALLKTREAGGPAAIVRAPGSNIGRVLDVVRANKVVPLFDDRAAAIEYIRSRRAS